MNMLLQYTVGFVLAEVDNSSLCFNNESQNATDSNINCQKGINVLTVYLCSYCIYTIL